MKACARSHGRKSLDGYHAIASTTGRPLPTLGLLPKCVRGWDGPRRANELVDGHGRSPGATRPKDPGLRGLKGEEGVGFVEFELAEILALEQVLRRLGDENMSSGCPLKELRGHPPTPKMTTTCSGRERREGPPRQAFRT